MYYSSHLGVQHHAHFHPHSSMITYIIFHMTTTELIGYIALKVEFYITNIDKTVEAVHIK